MGLLQHPFDWCDSYGAVAPTTGERLFLALPYLHADPVHLCGDACAQAVPDSFNILL